jgi:hypothetical protein
MMATGAASTSGRTQTRLQVCVCMCVLGGGVEFRCSVLPQQQAAGQCSRVRLAHGVLYRHIACHCSRRMLRTSRKA